MARYFATFVAGTKNIVVDILKQKFPSISFEELYPNLAVFKLDSDLRKDEDLPWFNNYFYLLNKFGSPVMQSFQKQVEWAIQRDTFIEKLKEFIAIHKFSKYRVYFFEERHSVSQQEELSQLKEYISAHTKLRYSAYESDFEIWFLKRREGISFVGARLSKKPDYQEVLEKGELRHELAYQLCYLAEPQSYEIILDPFCGHGSIPITLERHFKFRKLKAFDIDTRSITTTMKNRDFGYSDIEVSQEDGFTLKSLADNSVHKIVTDPPWGLFSELADLENRYSQMLKTFYRVLKSAGRVVLLTSQQDVVETIVKDIPFTILNKHVVQVGGKESAIFILEKE